MLSFLLAIALWGSPIELTQDRIRDFQKEYPERHTLSPDTFVTVVNRAQEELADDLGVSMPPPVDAKKLSTLLSTLRTKGARLVMRSGERDTEGLTTDAAAKAFTTALTLDYIALCTNRTFSIIPSGDKITTLFSKVLVQDKESALSLEIVDEADAAFTDAGLIARQLSDYGFLLIPADGKPEVFVKGLYRE